MEQWLSSPHIACFPPSPPRDFQKRVPRLAINAIIAIDVKGGVGAADISIRAPASAKRGNDKHFAALFSQPVILFLFYFPPKNKYINK